ncbi:rRNA biogenesis protein RRP5 [Nymphaea colorata]|nr:rRNA biogenesis protein RRP5 [Nymphaea colorata]XP_031485669.1 rRNA biogenesis protein RRP5 [Nymphaea colorata]
MAAKKFTKRKASDPSRGTPDGASKPNIQIGTEDDEAPDFPRGGGGVLSRVEVEQARTEAEAEFETEERTRENLGKRKRPRKTSFEDDDLGSLFGEGFAGKLPRLANKITIKNVLPGMKMLGVISEVNPKDLVVSLPGGLRGYVRAEEASDLLAENKLNEISSNKTARQRKNEASSGTLLSVFIVGQLVPCIVLDVEHHDGKEKKRILLSLRLSLLQKGLTLDLVQEGMVINANVKSIEDHGYILHLGSSSFSGFLPRSDGNEKGDNSIGKGQLLQVVVSNVDKVRKVVSFKPSLNYLCINLTKEYRGLSVDLLFPGMLVEAHLKSVLANGVLVSFLTYFTGTVDIFNLENLFLKSSWKDMYHIGMRVRARILFIDPITRAVGLTMNPHLLQGHLPPSHVRAGDVYEDARIIRIDGRSGLLLEVSSSPIHTPAYVKTSDATDEEGFKLETKFKEGNVVRVRVLDFRQMEGLAICAVKASAFEESYFTHADVKPGMVVRGKVIKIEVDAAVIQFLGGLKALCPLQHMSEHSLAKPPKKFKVGVDLVFRVLGGKSKRITVTHKRTLVKSKLSIVASYIDATEGMVTHGWIAKIEKHGCLVRFYNGVQGFTHISELGINQSEIDSCYHVGQVVKCRILSANPASRRINLSFKMSSERRIMVDIPELGSIVSGVVGQLSPSAIIVHVNGKSDLKGTIAMEHLADHLSHGSRLKALIKPGYEFKKLLVLDKDSKRMLLSAKRSLISSADQIPSDISQVQSGSVIHGYICNVIENGCFVRYLGHMTGFASKKNALDDHGGSVTECFCIGQSVRSHVLEVNAESRRVKVSLKQSSCYSSDASFMEEYFHMEDEIAMLQQSEPEGSDMKWMDSFVVGSMVEAEVQGLKEFGVVVSFKKYPDLVGFITNYQLDGNNVGVGSTVKALVIDISKVDNIVDLSLKHSLIEEYQRKAFGHSRSKKRPRGLGKDVIFGDTVNAVVELIKDNYLVLSLPEHGHAIGYALSSDYNTQKFSRKKYVEGARVVATIGMLPSPPSGRLLLLLKSLSEQVKCSSSKKDRKRTLLSVGSIVGAEITDIRASEILTKFSLGLHGRIYITEVCDHDDHQPFDLNPFSKFRIGQTLMAKIIAKASKPKDTAKSYTWELSVRPSVLSGKVETSDENSREDFDFSNGQHVIGYVINVGDEWARLAISRLVKGDLFVLDTSTDPSELQEFQKRFRPGQPLSCYILSINKDKRRLRLGLTDVVRQLDDKRGGSDMNQDLFGRIREGDIIGGKITEVLPGVGGLVIQISPHVFGKVHFTEVTDSWVSNPIDGYSKGQFVRCRVLEVGRSANGAFYVDLSLRDSFINSQAINLGGGTVDLSSSKRFTKSDDLYPNMEVKGYVKVVTEKGCFITLSRKIDARILLSNLSDEYIEAPEKGFPVGKLVHGRVLSVEPLSKRVDVSLRTKLPRVTPDINIIDMQSFKAGNIISGKIRRVEPYGLFITIDHTNTVGLCHVSEVPDEHRDSLEARYCAGEKVMAKILKINVEQGRVSLGMKTSCLGGHHTITPKANGIGKKIADNAAANDVSNIFMEKNGSMTADEVAVDDNVTNDLLIPSQIKSRASVLPLEVTFDDEELGLGHQVVDFDDSGITKTVAESCAAEKRRLKRKAKVERELQIKAAEDKLLNEDAAPTSVDDFEKLVRSSPNSSYLWIKYMAFMLSLRDVPKARSVAERALATINMRVEGEKLNVWIAYLNLENEYGIPRKEAVEKIFERACQSCDSKKLHLALLGTYERTGQQELANELLNGMTKKFRTSCKVWLRYIETLLKQGKGEAQAVVNRAILSLGQWKHIKFISQAAMLEFKHGLPDRGRSMFEKILRTYPKRIDLWNVYLDHEIRLKDQELIRALFERATSLSLPPKKMKSLFKKYLCYEKSCGDEERVEYVKRKAMEYVESATGP